MGWNIPYLNPADVKGFRRPQKKKKKKKLGHISPRQMGIIYPSPRAVMWSAGTTGGGGFFLRRSEAKTERGKKGLSTLNTETAIDPRETTGVRKAWKGTERHNK